MISDIILQAKKAIFFSFAVIEILFRYTKINDLKQILVCSGAGAETERRSRSGAGASKI